jgi:hypothetical protein
LVGDRNRSNWKELVDTLLPEKFRPKLW